MSICNRGNVEEKYMYGWVGVMKLEADLFDEPCTLSLYQKVSIKGETTWVLQLLRDITLRTSIVIFIIYLILLFFSYYS